VPAISGEAGLTIKAAFGFPFPWQKSKALVIFPGVGEWWPEPLQKESLTLSAIEYFLIRHPIVSDRVSLVQITGPGIS